MKYSVRVWERGTGRSLVPKSRLRSRVPCFDCAGRKQGCSGRQRPGTLHTWTYAQAQTTRPTRSGRVTGTGEAIPPEALAGRSGQGVSSRTHGQAERVSLLSARPCWPDMLKGTWESPSLYNVGLESTRDHSPSLALAPGFRAPQPASVLPQPFGVAN